MDLFHAFHSRSERKPKRELFFVRTRKSEREERSLPFRKVKGKNRPRFSLFSNRVGKKQGQQPLFKNDDDSAERRSLSFAVGRVGKAAAFSTLSTVRRRSLWEAWKSLTVLFHAFHNQAARGDTCGKGGKVYGPFPRFPQQE